MPSLGKWWNQLRFRLSAKCLFSGRGQALCSFHLWQMTGEAEEYDKHVVSVGNRAVFFRFVSVLQKHWPFFTRRHFFTDSETG